MEYLQFQIANLANNSSISQLIFNNSNNEFNSTNLKSFIASLYASRAVHRHQPTNMIEEWWINLVHYFGDFYMLVAFYCFMNVCYAIGGILFWICDRFQLLDKYKIQKKYVNNMDYLRCLQNLVVNYIFVIIPIMFAAYPVLSSYLSFEMALPLPSIFTFLWQFAFCIIAEDIGHYWLHRALHTPWLYKNIHKVHHTYSAPFGLAASYAHPIEVLILGLPTFLGPAIIGTHYFTFFSWVLFRQLDAVSTHSGYNIPHPFDLLPFHGGAPDHDYHHKNFIFNYSSRFVFMDKIFGTYRPDKCS